MLSLPLRKKASALRKLKMAMKQQPLAFFHFKNLSNDQDKPSPSTSGENTNACLQFQEVQNPPVKNFSGHTDNDGIYFSIGKKYRGIIRTCWLSAFSPFPTMFSKANVFRAILPFPNKPWFLRVCSTSLLKTL